MDEAREDVPSEVVGSEEVLSAGRPESRIEVRGVRVVRDGRHEPREHRRLGGPLASE
jgi:hypothetical protein